jgi:hypothetical protein
MQAIQALGASVAIVGKDQKELDRQLSSFPTSSGPPRKG